ncbi:MAG TPA: hypothetical protein VK081_10270 [Planctomycetota bacterium]|nr:hypothetical protein [Planctomycetota bacterium]
MIAGALLLALAVFIAALPSLLSIDVLRPRLERAASSALGAPVKVRDYSLGWWSGITVDELEVGQPAGFAADRPLLRVAHADLDVSFLRLITGTVVLRGRVDGMQLVVVQKDDGRINVRELGERGAEPPEPPDRSAEELAEDLKRLSADLTLRDASIDVVHETKGALESIRELQAQLSKPLGSTDFTLRVDAALAGGSADAPAGALHLAADVDATLRRPIDVELSAAHLDFARYRPLVDAVLGPGRLDALQGVLDGTLKARIEQRARVAVEGNLAVAGPRIAGALVHGMDLQAPQWTFAPNMTLEFAPDGGLPRADLAGFRIDLGFLRLEGVPAADAAQAFAGAPALAIDYTVDLQALGRLGGPIPDAVAAQPGQASGRLAFAVPGSGIPSDWSRFLTEALRVEASLAVDQLALSGASLGAIALRAGVEAGTVRAELAPGATVNGGAATFAARVDLREPGRPATFELGVQDARLDGSAAHVLQYAMPLLAGLGGQAVSLTGTGTIALSCNGPAHKAEGESWLAWLNRWSGSGTVGLREASLQPAAAFAGLVQFADPGGGGRLALDEFLADVALHSGAVETGLAKLAVKGGRRIGLSGRTGLDGTLDHALDLTDLLRGHRDGEKVLSFLKGAAIEAKITGTLAAPHLAMPDLDQLFAAALKNAAGQQVQKTLEDLLKRIR